MDNIRDYLNSWSHKETGATVEKKLFVLILLFWFNILAG